MSSFSESVPRFQSLNSRVGAMDEQGWVGLQVLQGDAEEGQLAEAQHDARNPNIALLESGTDGLGIVLHWRLG